jgi:hypothetical protein
MTGHRHAPAAKSSTKPADLQVRISTKYELASAKTFEVARPLLARADHVIE